MTRLRDLLTDVDFFDEFYKSHQAHEAFEGVRHKPTKPPGFAFFKD